MERQGIFNYGAAQLEDILDELGIGYYEVSWDEYGGRKRIEINTEEWEGLRKISDGTPREKDEKAVLADYRPQGWAEGMGEEAITWGRLREWVGYVSENYDKHNDYLVFEWI